MEDREKDAEKVRQLQNYPETEKQGGKQKEKGAKRTFKSETQQVVWEINACQNSQDLAKAMSLLQGLIDKDVPHLPNEVMSHLKLCCDRICYMLSDMSLHRKKHRSSQTFDCMHICGFQSKPTI
jgi:hypothetical protein